MQHYSLQIAHKLGKMSQMDSSNLSRQKPVRVAVVGAAMRAVWGLRAIANEPRFQIAALVDVIPEKMELLAAEAGLRDIPVVADFADCLASCEFGAVAVFTPDGTHASIVVPSLRAGKWVFVEKPLDCSVAAARQIVAEDQKQGGRTFVGFNLRYAPVYRKVHELISQGRVGQVLTIQADEFYDGGRTYFRRWNRHRAMGGGLWITKACHDFDLLYWMAGAAPESVMGLAGLHHYVPRKDASLYCRECQLATECADHYDVHQRPDHIWRRMEAIVEAKTGRRPDLCLFNSDKDTIDHGMAMVQFANGVMATYTLSVVSGITNRRMRIGGVKGTIDADLAAGTVDWTGRDPSTTERFQVHSDQAHGGADGFLIPEFANFVCGMPAQVISPAEAIVSIQIGEGVTRSCDRGERINL